MGTIRTIAEVALIIVMLASLGVNITHEDATDNIYTCDVKGEDSYCFDIRDYGDRIDYRCMYDKTNLRKYFSCVSGWKKITLEDALVKDEIIISNSGDSSQWKCSPAPNYGCVKI